MSQAWLLIRRHPIVTIIFVLLALGFAAAPSRDGVIGVVFLGGLTLLISWGISLVRARSGRFVGDGGPTSVVPGRRTKAMPTTNSDTIRHQRDQQAADLARREQDLAAREADIQRRETGSISTTQQATNLTPQQMSAKTDSEQLLPAGQSAFAETAHRPIPVAPRRESSLITINHLLAMTPTGFEEFCVTALEGIGYKDVRRVGGAGDLTADIFGTDNMGRSTVVQCKRYKPGTKVGSPALQMFIGMKSVHHQAERGIYMTTADYSVPAVRLAKQHDIVLIDGDDMVKIAGLVMMPQSTPQVAAGAARYCTNCGAEFSGEERFCKSCGAARAA